MENSDFIESPEDGTMEIFFRDFNESTQKEILTMFGITAPEEMNWDTIPMFYLTTEPDDATS